jgi:hypothetical protein
VHPRAATAVFTLAAVLLLSGALAVPAAALQFGLEGAGSNIQFPWTQVTPTAGTGPYPATDYFLGGNAWLDLPLGEDASLRFTYERDPVLRNVLTASVQFERGIASLSVGPFFGLFNSTATPFSTGISTSLRFQWPGVAYVSVRSDGAIAIGELAGALGAEPQARAELGAGFYTRNAIVSGLVSASTFSETIAGGSVVTDALSSYLLTVDLFKKNVPYSLLLDAGYEVRSRYYGASAVTDALGCVVLGAKATVQAGPGWALDASFQSGVYVFGFEALQGRSPDQGDIFFSATFGVSFDTEKLAKAIRTAGPLAAENANTAGSDSATPQQAPERSTRP